MSSTDALIWIILTYIGTSIPTAYILMKLYRQVDIQKIGSGNVGTSNVIQHGGLYLGIFGGAVDCLIKGSFPILLLKNLGYEIEMQAIIALASIIGHNWSLYIKFRGGRGLATSIGIFIGLSLWIELLILSILLLVFGKLFSKDTGPWSLIAFIIIPVISLLLNRDEAICLLMPGILLLIIFKRITANWKTAPTENDTIYHILLNRLVWDRDTHLKENWISRKSTLQKKAD